MLEETGNGGNLFPQKAEKWANTSMENELLNAQS